MDDPYGLRRFVDAQDDSPGGSYQDAVAELRAGRKRTHWMWYVFPQVAGLGHSPTARTFAIGSLAEAQAYLRHPVLGPRLLDCARLLLALDGDQPEAVLGGTDALKLRSSMTLFSRADPDQALFRQVLDKFYRGAPDQRTIGLLGGTEQR